MARHPVSRPARTLRGARAVLTLAASLAACRRIIAAPAPPAATQLLFTVEPASAIAGQLLRPVVSVRAADAQGNVAPDFTGTVTVAFGHNPAGGTLGGTTTVAAVAGVVSFDDLSVDKASTGYRLTATATGLSAATSGAFSITPGAGTQLVFSVQPGTTVADHQIAPAVKVRALDAFGNLVTGFTGSIGVALGDPAGATLGGTSPVAAVGGVASFFDLIIKQAGAGYTLVATASGMGPVSSAAFDVTSGPATQLGFTLQPTTTVAGQPLAPAVHGKAVDAGGDPVPGVTRNRTGALRHKPAGG